jgi:hypothetical protein
VDFWGPVGSQHLDHSFRVGDQDLEFNHLLFGSSPFSSTPEHSRIRWAWPAFQWELQTAGVFHRSLSIIFVTFSHTWRNDNIHCHTPNTDFSGHWIPFDPIDIGYVEDKSTIHPGVSSSEVVVEGVFIPGSDRRNVSSGNQTRQVSKSYGSVIYCNWM